MEIIQTQIVFAALGIAQAIIMTILWCIVFARTQHRGGWFLIPFLPLAGMLLAPVVLGGLFNFLDNGFDNTIAMSVTMSVVIFIFSVAPLVVLALRLLTGRIEIRRDADVFADE